MLPNLFQAHGLQNAGEAGEAAFASAVTFHGHLVLVCEPHFLHHQTKSRQIPQARKTNKRVKIQPLSSVPGGTLCHGKGGSCCLLSPRTRCRGTLMMPLTVQAPPRTCGPFLQSSLSWLTVSFLRNI